MAIPLIPILGSAAPALVTWLLRGFLAIAPSIAATILTRAGVAAITYTGISALVTALDTTIFNSFAGVDPTVMQLFGVLQVGTCFKILLSAITVKLTIKGLSGAGSIKKIVLR